MHCCTKPNARAREAVLPGPTVGDMPRNPGPTTFTDLYTLPHFYDVLHGPDTAKEVRGLLRIAKKYGAAPMPGARAPVWLEPACGSGRYLRALAAKGARTLGFDLEPGMVAYAIEQAREFGVARKSEYFVGDMRNFDCNRTLPRIDFAFNLINTIRHLGSDAAVLEHFGAMARVLKPEAVYAVGMSMCAYGHEPETEDVWKGKRNGVEVLQNVTYLPAPGGRGVGARTERVISHLTVTHGSGKSARVEHIDSTYGLRAYDLHEWGTLIEKSPLRAVAVVDERGDRMEPPAIGYCLWILKRR